MTPRFWQWIGLCGISLLIAGLLSAHVDPLAYAGGRQRDDDDRVRRNSSAFAALLGEFRTSFSDIMFIKTERYLHAGVAYMPHHGESALSAEDLAAEVDEHQDEIGIPDDDEWSHSGIPTLIPRAEDDFRGWIGRLHREVHPWRDPDREHIHTDGRELLPWFRLMTLSDPHFVRGYVAGAFWLQHQDPEAARAFVDEGLRHNPDAFELYVSRAFLLIREGRQLGDLTQDTLPDAVVDLLRSARDDFYRAAELGLAQRPDVVDEDGFGHGWVRYQENDLLAATRMSIVLSDRLGETERAQQLEQRFAPLLQL